MVNSAEDPCAIPTKVIPIWTAERKRPGFAIISSGPSERYPRGRYERANFRPEIVYLNAISSGVHRVLIAVSETSGGLTRKGSVAQWTASLVYLRTLSLEGDTQMRFKRRLCAFCFLIVTASSSAQNTTIDFNSDRAGQPPSGFSTALTGRGQPGKWVVMKDDASPDRGNVLAQIDADPTDYRFPVCVYDGLTAKDADISVIFKPVSGRVDQGAGIVWRYMDKDNYYVVRANALEGNVVLYKVQNGKRSDLPLNGAGRTYGMKRRSPRDSGGSCVSWRKEVSSKSTTRVGSSTRWRTTRSEHQGKLECGPRPTRSSTLTTCR